MFVPLALLAPALLGAVDAPITTVTVYSDRARVTRTAKVALHGTESIELPLLLDSVDTTSIRLEARGANIQRVDIAPVPADALPVDQAKALLEQIRKVDDQILGAQAQDQAYATQLAELHRLNPRLTPAADPQHPQPKLNPAGWSAVLAFSTTREEKLETHRRELAQHLLDLGQSRATLVEKARLLGGARRHSGYRVIANVSGEGSAELALTYQVGPARWYPSYDVSLNPSTSQVQLALAGLVSQETGEDWSHAALILSTAVPSGAQAFPKVLTWKIGQRERFIPTPVAQPEPQAPAAPIAFYRAAPDHDRDGIADQLDALVGRTPPEDKPSPSPEANDKTKEQAAVLRLEDLAGKSAVTQEDLKNSGVNHWAEKPDAPKPEKMPEPAAPPATVMAAEAPQEESIVSRLPGAVADGLFKRSDRAEPMMSSNVGLAPPVTEGGPQLAADLPASLAGGYDLAFPSAQVESVQSGGGARRVALLSQTWPVTVERKVFPALSPESFLIAELKSPSPTALPGGTANLFVGEDPAGVAHLDLVSPGEKFTLPLGLDRAVRPIRNVQVVEAEKGVFSKDEITRYDVTTEIANPYRMPISLRVLDQWPLTDQSDVEIQLVKTAPYAIQDPVTGSLEWRVIVPPGGKTTVAFTYSIRRPKGWRLHQL